jgi:hypothetical protein
MTMEWARESRNNGQYAETRAREYYVTHGVCPPVFPQGFRMETDSMYDEKTTEQLKKDAVKWPVKHYDSTRTPRWKEGEERPRFLKSRRDEYDNAMRNGDRSRILTTWDPISEGTKHDEDRQDDELTQDKKQGTDAEKGEQAEGDEEDQRDTHDQQDEEFFENNEEAGDPPDRNSTVVSNGNEQPHVIILCADLDLDYHGLLPVLRTWPVGRRSTRLEDMLKDDEDFGEIASTLDLRIGVEFKLLIYSVRGILQAWLNETLEKPFADIHDDQKVWELIMTRAKRFQPSDIEITAK